MTVMMDGERVGAVLECRWAAWSFNGTRSSGTRRRKRLAQHTKTTNTPQNWGCVWQRVVQLLSHGQLCASTTAMMPVDSPILIRIVAMALIDQYWSHESEAQAP